MALLDRVTTGVLSHPVCITGLWTVALAVSAPFAMQFIDECKFEFEPASGTPSARAMAKFKEAFPEKIGQDMEVVVISCESPCRDVTNFSFAAEAVQQLSDKCASFRRVYPSVLQSYADHYTFKNSTPGRLGLPSPLLSKSKQVMIFQVTMIIRPEHQEVSIDILDRLASMVADLDLTAKSQRGTPLSVKITGPGTVFRETLKAVKDDFQQRDLMVLPCALLVLAIRIRSLRLLLLPVMCLACAVTVTFAIFLPLAKHVVMISPLAPSNMTFVSMALSIDYSLFLLTRFGEETGKGASMEDALRSMMSYSGHVVIISGAVLMICYVGICFYPGGGVPSVGMGTASAILMCVLLNLTFTPAAIAAFPTFFSPPRGTGRGRGCCSRPQGAGPKVVFWTLAKHFTQPPLMVVVPILFFGMLVGPLMELTTYKEAFSNKLTNPRHGMARVGWQQLEEEFAVGMLAPTSMLVEAARGSTVNSNEYFDLLCSHVQVLLSKLSPEPFGMQVADLLAIAALPNPSNPRELICLRWSDGPVDPLHPHQFTAQHLLQDSSPLGELYRESWARLVNPQNTSSMLLLTLPFDAFGGLLRPSVRALREAIRDAGDQAYLFSLPSSIFDVVELTYHRLPRVVSITILCVFLVIATAFRAALAPVKMFFTVVAPVAAVYGVAVWVYQDGGLNWTQISAVSGGKGVGMHWATPVFTSTILIGLALDYDVFLFARVRELRSAGFSNRAAVRGALCMTGPTITSAGLVMAIALGGLLLIDIPSNNQLGFVMAFGVLVDTFLIRMCLVPTVLTLGAGLNYWPWRPPPVTKSEGDLKALLQSRPTDLLETSMIDLSHLPA